MGKSLKLNAPFLFWLYVLRVDFTGREYCIENSARNVFVKCKIPFILCIYNLDIQKTGFSIHRWQIVFFWHGNVKCEKMLDELFELAKEDKTCVGPNQHLLLFHSAHTWMCVWVFMRWEMQTRMIKKEKERVNVCFCLCVSVSL